MDAALRYVGAAWKVYQAPEIGDHLAQVYEKQGDMVRAMHMYSLALAALPANGDPRFDRLISHFSSRRVPATNSTHSQDELQKMRTFQVLPFFAAGKSAEFTVVGKWPKVNEVKFLNSADELRKVDSATAALTHGLELPDDALTRVVRRGILSCLKARQDCLFVVDPVTTPRVPQPTLRVNSHAGE